MKLSIEKIAGIIGGEVIGDASYMITGVSSFEDAGSDDITFAGDAKFLKRLEKTGAGAVIVPDSFSMDEKEAVYPVLLKTENPKLSFFKLVSRFHPGKKPESFRHPTAVLGDNVTIGVNTSIEAGVCIGDNVTIGANVRLMPNVVIGDFACIGDHSLVKPNVTIMERTRIGQHAVIHSGTVIGADGFGFTSNEGIHEKIIHTGYVHIGNHVEIGACNTIDRGTLGTTSIGNGVKTDNLVHIAHNVKIGDHTLIVAQAGIAGSTRIGKNVIIAGKAGVSGHLTIGDGTIIGPYAGVHTSVKGNEIVSGMPHMPHNRWRKVVAVISRLPEMKKTIFSFGKRIEALEALETAAVKKKDKNKSSS